MHEHIDLHGRYYFGLTEAVQRGEIRALRDPRDAIQDLYLPPGQYENTRFSFHCYSAPISVKGALLGCAHQWTRLRKGTVLQRSGPGRVFKGLGVAKRYCKTHWFCNTIMQC